MSGQTRNKTPGRTRFGFVEWAVILVLLLVLAAVSARFLMAVETPGQRDLRQAREGILLLKSALGAYALDLGRPMPGSLMSLVEEGYFETLPEDPWGRQYRYELPGTRSGRGYDLYSLGPDGRIGGDDVVEWDLFRRPMP
ncbi:MAG: type II secretion system protein GspG [Gammaproteobacteria bacterium]|nr:type II secretion system protein GspG [Gammaproteobacteria bacterium]